ncbi:MAG: hypothetical protein K2Z80_23275 [Xanthobacteraceae bacterium]|nr:hypothetical protein [Xanthobacteraceae bacterium]
MQALLPALAFAIMIAAQCAAIITVRALDVGDRPPPNAPDRPEMTRLSQRAEPLYAICAQRDLQAVTMIERRGEAQDATSRKLFDAFLTVMSARNACREGRGSEALSSYDSVASALSPAQPAQ